MICRSYHYQLTDSKMCSPKFMGQIYCLFWVPERILTDQGRNFESDLLKELCEIGQVKKIRTSGYHRQTNGQCEHFNATLFNMLGTLPEKPKITGREQVTTLVHAYNCTRNIATNFTPYWSFVSYKK